MSSIQYFRKWAGRYVCIFFTWEFLCEEIYLGVRLKTFRDFLGFSYFADILVKYWSQSKNDTYEVGKIE